MIELNDDVGETIGWPELARTVAGIYRGLPYPARAVIVAGNYGEAGAIDRYGPALGLPPAYSGHNAYGDWGPPPPGSAPVIALGLDADETARLRGCRTVARIDNRARVDNDERGNLRRATAAVGEGMAGAAPPRLTRGAAHPQTSGSREDHEVRVLRGRAAVLA